jgi:hypothetical protein
MAISKSKTGKISSTNKSTSKYSFQSRTATTDTPSLKSQGAGYSTTNREGVTSYFKSSRDADGGKAISKVNSKGVTIPVDTLGAKNSPANVPLAKTTPVPNLSLGMAEGFDITDKGYAPQPKIADDSLDNVAQRQQQNLLQRIQAMAGIEPQNLQDDYLKAEKKAGIQNMQKDVNNYTSQLNQIVASSQAEQLKLEGQGRGQTQGFVGGEQARINREAAIQALPVQAQLDAAQGNLQMAQSRLDKLFTIHQQDVQNKFNFQSKLVDTFYDFMDEQEKTRANQLLAVQKEKADAKNANLNYLRELSMMAIDNGNTGAIGVLGSIDPNSSTFEADVASASQMIRKPVSASSTKAPDLQNFGTADNPDWRQYNTSTGSWDEVEGVGGGTSGNLTKVQRTKVSDSVVANKELASLINEYKTLLDDVGFEGSTFGGKNLGTFQALKGRMTTVLKKAETLGTLDKGVTDLIDQLVGEIPEKGGLTQNFFGFKSRQISSQLDTQKRLIEDIIKRDEARLGGTSFSLTSSDFSELDSLFGETSMSTDSSFDPSEYF